MGTPEVWSDLHHNIKIDAHGSVKKVINIDAIKTSIDNILRTRPGERVMLPTFAAGLQDLVFEGCNEATYDRIADQIREHVTLWDDRVIVNTINFQVSPDKNQMTVVMTFQVKGYDQIFEHSTSLSGE